MPKENQAAWEEGLIKGIRDLLEHEAADQRLGHFDKIEEGYCQHCGRNKTPCCCMRDE